MKMTVDVEIATAAELKITVVFLLQNRHEDRNASIAERIMATGPP